MASAKPTLLYRFYVALAGAIAPFAFRKVAKKLRAHDVPEARIRERIGYATVARPMGQLVWFHAASVGESLSVLALINAMIRIDPKLNVLITSGTATSAKILADRMPTNCHHQFAPLDSASALTRFLDHWEPDLAIFVESELWPQMLVLTKRRGIPLALLNARLSATSRRNWHRFKATAQYLLSQFSLVVAQTPETLKTLLALGANPTTTRIGDDLKAAAGALPYDKHTHTNLRSQIGERPIWVASSTHDGEDEIVLSAHQTALETLPDLLLVLVPRHPGRRYDIQTLLNAKSLNTALRSASEPITARTQVYLADTLGETGLWYALAPLVFVGGSLVPVGGHNPYEPAHAGAAVLHGPEVTNFVSAYQKLTDTGGCVCVNDASALADQIVALLPKSDRLDTLQKGANDFGTGLGQTLDQTSQDLFALLETV